MTTDTVKRRLTPLREPCDVIMTKAECLVFRSSIEWAFYVEQIGINELPLLLSLCSRHLDKYVGFYFTKHSNISRLHVIFWYRVRVANQIKYLIIFQITKHASVFSCTVYEFISDIVYVYHIFVSLCYSEPNAYIIYSRYQLYVYGKKSM